MAFSPMCLEIVKPNDRACTASQEVVRSYRYYLTTSVSLSSPLV